MRAAVLFLVISTAALGDEVDLSPRRGGKPPEYVLRAEGGTSFAPYGLAGVAISWLTESQFAFELGAGGGFPGLQLGFAARRLFGERGSYLATEIAIAGNTRVNRGASLADRYLNAGAVSATGSVWTTFGLGFEQREDFYDLSVVASLVLTTASLTPSWSIHGGVGFGF